MQSYLPTLHNLLGAAGVAAGLLMFLLHGALATPRRTLPEVQLVAGWGLTCLILTTWGVFVAATLLVPLAVLGALGRSAWRIRAFAGASAPCPVPDA